MEPLTVIFLMTIKHENAKLCYNLTEDLTFIQITLGILNAIDLRLKQGLKMKTEFADFKRSFPKIRECYGPVNISFKC